MSARAQVEMLDTGTIAGWLGITRETIVQMLCDGAMPYYKVGNQYRVHPDDYAKWLESQRVEPGPRPIAAVESPDAPDTQEIAKWELPRSVARSPRKAALKDVSAKRGRR